MRHIQLIIVLLIAYCTANAQNKIKGYEYWFDNDYTNKVVTSIAPVPLFALNTLVPTTGLTSGIHTVQIRTWNESALFSSTLSQFFYKMPETTAVSSIVAYEYWIDNDYASAVSVSTPAQQQVLVNPLINVPALSNGIHTFSIRFKDNAKQWGSILSQFFYKIPSQTVANNLITAYRYWVDDDFAKATNVRLSTSVQHLNLVDNIALTQVPRGEHTINFQFKDAMGLWSVVSTDSIQNITTVGLLDNTFEKNISFYPNPTDGLIHVDLGSTYNEISINVFDANGGQIKQSHYAKAQTLEINLNECQSGIYFMCITSDDKKATLRVIKK